MAPRKSGIKNIVAKLVTGKTVPCAFCNRKVDDELQYGKLYAIGNVQCHYYCVLLSSCLIQKGKDEHGLFGFLYEDILAEVERCKKHKCSYCSQIGANLGCSISQCRKQFHLPCGRERNSVSLFYGNYKTFCQNHAPKQKIPEVIMVKARLRKSRDNKIKKTMCSFKDLKELSLDGNTNDSDSNTESVCVICYEHVEGYPTPNTFWPPCCARDAWFHRTCLQRMALSAGMHYIKCPLCNDKENFYQAVISQGYYVPDRDAAWELEQNAFAEIYERPISCSAPDCVCPQGRSHDAENGPWSISVCMLCGSSGQHGGCVTDPSNLHVHICAVCKPAAPEDLENLANSIEAVISQEQVQTSSRRRPGRVMPSRMSLRRTKRNVSGPVASSSTLAVKSGIDSQISNTTSSRDELNLKRPRKPTTETTINSSINLKFSPNKLEKTDQMSPLKLINSKNDSPSKFLEEGLKNKFGNQEVAIKDELLDELRRKFKKPQPLSAKRKIVNEILNGLFDNVLQETKQKEPVKQWCSPKKCVETDDDVIVVPESPPEVIDLTKSQDIITPRHETAELPPIDNTTPLHQDDNTPIFNTPKKLKTIDTLTDSSLEISANNEIVNIDVFKLENKQNEQFTKLKIPLKKEKCGFKCSPCNKEELDNENIDIDLESFKNQYLDEVSGTKVNEKPNPVRKRKPDSNEIIVNLESKKRKLKRRSSISIKDKNIQVKIKWRREQLKLQFNNIKTKKKSKKFRQYVLQYSPEKATHSRHKLDGNRSVLTKPEVDITPIKKKKIKQEKTPDNLIQTSIQKFFKVTSPGKE
ncbi:unnamed protein product [Arctia plantaginis]|uniref:G2/M phase-specific E3 ubiquitin-protein ligase n=1 Tax=Arctia plantaginis TaxID=874455 RepID=A0A8S0ZWN4_ARCPL|nr:unnamed protein product [Arctia plantaginis]